MGVNQTADPQQAAFALAQLQRLFGNVGTPYGVAPTSGPYNWSPQAEVGGTRPALDGSMLGGINLGYVNDIYGQNPDQAAGDARIREIFGPMFGGQTAAQAPPPATPQASLPFGNAPTPKTQGFDLQKNPQAPVTPFGNAPTPKTQGVDIQKPVLPLDFSALVNGGAPTAAPATQSFNMARGQMPQQSVFTPASGQNQNQGMAGLLQIVNQLLSQRGGGQR